METPPPSGLPTPQALMERALRAKLQLKQQLKTCHQRCKESDAAFRALRRQEQTVRRADQSLAIGKRVREEVDQQSQSAQNRRRRSRDEGGDMEEDRGAEAVAETDEPAPAPAAEDEPAPAAEDEPAPAAEGGPAADDEPALATAAGEDESAPAPAAVDDDMGVGASADAKPSTVDTGAGAGEAGGRGPGQGGRSPRVSLDEYGRQRSRKMFGVLMGTLARARVEVSSQGTAQREKLSRVDEKLRDDRARGLQVQRETLVANRAKEQAHREALDAERAAIEERLTTLGAVAHSAALAISLATETTPRVYYQPKVHNAATRARLAAQQAAALPPLRDKLDEHDAAPIEAAPPPSGRPASEGADGEAATDGEAAGGEAAGREAAGGEEAEPAGGDTEAMGGEAAPMETADGDAAEGAGAAPTAAEKAEEERGEEQEEPALMKTADESLESVISG